MSHRLSPIFFSMALSTACGGDTSELEALIAAQADLIEAQAEQIASLESSLASLEDSVSNTLATMETSVSGLEGDLTSLETDLSDLQSDLLTLDTDLTSLSSTVDDQEVVVANASKLLDYVEVEDEVVKFVGANVYVQSGSGSTDDGGSLTGLGNLVIGYGETDADDTWNGSHMLVLGMNHSFSGYGGIIAGYDNEAAGEFASILGGELNFVDGDNSVVVAGYMNEATGEDAAILAGELILTSGYVSAGVGGSSNEATNSYTVVLAGTGEIASAGYEYAPN